MSSLENHWHLDTYHCENLDPLTPENQAWWCGRYFFPCQEGDDPGGYPDNLDSSIEWWGVAQSPSAPTTVTLTAVLNHDVESGYDFLRLEYETPTGWSEVVEYTGTGTGVSVDQVWVIEPDEYVGAALDEIHLRWRVESDGAWSDGDCVVLTSGAAQLDLIEVTLQNDGVETTVLETCEPGDPVHWQVVEKQGTGDFAMLRPGVYEIDPCVSNQSMVWSFVDDGDVVPGTEGYPGSTWTYGPGGYIVNPEGGLAGPDEHLHNEIWSPVLAWPGSEYEGAVLSFDVYGHLPFELESSGMFYVWHVRSIDTGNPADIDLAMWKDRDTVYYGENWHRQVEDVSDLIATGCTHVQISLGVHEQGWVWGIDGTDGTPAPYFDNVSLKAYTSPDPILITRSIDLANDRFPATGIVDVSSPASNSVRFDMCQDVLSGLWDLAHGDSIIVDASAAGSGASLIGPPRMFWRLWPNPVFDPYRTHGSATTGNVEGAQVYLSGGSPVEGRYSFDLPDDGFLFPGDVLRYYFRAADDQGGVSILPADTTGFSSPKLGLADYPGHHTFRALPTLRSLVEGDQPSLLVWYDAGSGTEEHVLASIFDQLGLQLGIDYDVFYTNGAQNGLPNGLDGLSNASLLAGYETILYASGTLDRFTLMDGAHEAGTDDLSVLQAWLGQGEKHLLLTGDGLADDLDSSTAGPGFLATWMGVSFIDSDVGTYAGLGHSIFSAPDPSSSVLRPDLLWDTPTDCPGRSIAALLASGAERIAEFTDEYGQPLNLQYGTAFLNTDITTGSQVVTVAMSLKAVSNPTKATTPEAVRTLLIQDLLAAFGHGTGAGAGNPDVTLSSVNHSLTETVSVFSTFDAPGLSLQKAQLGDGSTVDATLTVTLVDSFGQPVANYPAEDIWLESTGPGLVTRAGASGADRRTDESGTTTISDIWRVSGSTDPLAGESLQVVVGGVALTSGQVPLLVNSADITADSEVDLADLALFSRDYFGEYSYASDFYRDGQLGLADMALMSRELSLDVQESAEGHESAGSNILGIYFDEAATTSSIFMTEPGFVTAYVVLKRPTASQLNGVEYQVRITGPDHLIMDWGQPPNTLNAAVDPVVIRGYGSPVDMTAYHDGSYILQTIEIYVPVVSVYQFYLEPVGASGTTPCYAGTMPEILPLTTPVSDYATPVAAINGNSGVDHAPPSMVPLGEPQDQIHSSPPNFWSIQFVDTGLGAGLAMAWWGIDTYATPEMVPFFTEHDDSQWTQNDWSIPEDVFDALEDGPHTVFFVVVDDDGNMAGQAGEASWSFIKETASASEYILFDDFSDGDYTQNPTWTELPDLDGTVSIVDHDGDDEMRLVRGSSNPAIVEAPAAIGAADFLLTYTSRGVRSLLSDRGSAYLLDDSGVRAFRLMPDTYYDHLSFRVHNYDETGEYLGFTDLCRVEYDLNAYEHTYALRRIGDQMTVYADGVEMCSCTYSDWDSWHDNLTGLMLSGRGGGNGSGLDYDDISIVALGATSPVDVSVDYSSEGNLVSWAEGSKAAVDFYRIYRSESGSFEPSPELLVSEPTASPWLDVLGNYDHHYLVTAVDMDGNESSPATPSTITGVGENQIATFGLLGNIPNPFNPATTILFELPSDSDVDLKVFDASGRLIRTVLSRTHYPAGRHGAEWNGTDESGRMVAAGVYFYRLSAGAEAGIGRMVLLK